MLENADRDEPVSWLAAFALMVIATVFTVASRILGFDPFTMVFDLFIVYLPAAVLLVGVILQARRQ
jgi:hypothetical protein